MEFDLSLIRWSLIFKWYLNFDIEDFDLDLEEVSLNLRSLNRYSLTLKLIKLIDVGYLIFDLEEGVEFGIEVEKFDPEEAKFDIEGFHVLPKETEIDLEEAESDIKNALFDPE